MFLSPYCILKLCTHALFSLHYCLKCEACGHTSDGRRIPQVTYTQRETRVELFPILSECLLNVFLVFIHFDTDNFDGHSITRIVESLLYGTDPHCKIKN